MQQSASHFDWLPQVAIDQFYISPAGLRMFLRSWNVGIGSQDMRKVLALAMIIGAAYVSMAHAQAPLKSYTDASGYLDVQKLTCAQLAGTYQEDADLLMAWYSGWYNGLAKKHLANPERAKRLEHEVIVHCKANPGIQIIDAIAIVFKDERMRLGIEMK